jgi:hypothetical protein
VVRDTRVAQREFRGCVPEMYGNRKYDVRCGVCGQIQLYAQRQLAATLTHESPSEMEFAQLATIKAVLLGQASGLDRWRFSGEWTRWRFRRFPIQHVNS